MLPPIKINRFLILDKFLLLGILLLVGCQSEQKSSEPVSIGYVSKSLGFPVVNRYNQKYILARQSRIYPADIFDTDESSMVEITFLDESRITITQKSHLVLHNYVSAKKSSSMDLNLTKGTMRADLNSRMRLKLRTPLAVAQLKGGGSYARFASNALEIVMLESGNMKVTNDDGEVAINTKSYGTTVVAGSAPQTPYLWSNRRLRRVILATTVQADP